MTPPSPSPSRTPPVPPLTLAQILTYEAAYRCQCHGERAWHEDVLPQRGPAPSCSFCGQPLTDVEDAWLELFDATALQFPNEPENLLAAYAHQDCGPETGYNVAFTQLLTDGVDGDKPKSWLNHLLQKKWFCPTFATELVAAYQAAQSLAVASMRPVTQAIPQRRPRASKNPRAISVTMRARVMERDNFRCRRCGNGPSVSPLEIDHIVPVAKGGTGDFENLQVLCQVCNAGKQDREPHPHDLGRHV